MKEFALGFKLCIFYFLFTISLTAKSQVLVNENFEGSFPPAGWSFINIGGNAWSQDAYNVIGTKSMVSQSAGSACNAWAFTPSLSLTAGTLYRISYWYSAQDFYNPYEKFKVTIGSGATIASQTTTVHDYPNFSTSAFVQAQDTITVPANGNYNIAFNCYSLAGFSAFNVDDITITKLLPVACSGVPFIGGASGPTEVALNTNFTLSLQGNYALYTGLQFQWQSSPQGNNSFTNMVGGNTQNYSTAQNIARDYRCVISCSNTGASLISNVVTVGVPNWGSLYRQKYLGEANNNYIRGMFFLTPATGFAAFTNGIRFTQDSGKTYIKRPITTNNTNYNSYAINLTFGFSAMGVYAFSQDSLLAYGDYGAEPTILFSANQGITWKVVFHQPYAVNPDVENSIFDMKFPAGSPGIAINQKYIIETSDRGQNWNVVGQIPSYRTSKFSKLSTPSATIAYAAAGDFLYKKQDDYWFELSYTMPPNNGGMNFNNVSFVSNTTGFISRDDNHAIYKTTNGGIAWQQMNDLDLSPVTAADMFFINDSTGFIADKYAYNILRTANGGATWEYCKKNTPHQYLLFGMSRLFFLNNQTGWASGKGDEYLLLTTSGGNPTLPRSLFKIDTSQVTLKDTVYLKSFSKPAYQHKWYKNGALISTAFTASYYHNPYINLDTLQLIVTNGIDADTSVSYQQFAYTVPPIISSFTPTAAAANTTVTITGFGFVATSAVTFGGMPAKSFTVNSFNSITAVIAGGLSGQVSVTAASGTATANGFNFVLPPAPAISSFSPIFGPVGTVVTVTGNNFNPAAAANIVYFGKIKARIISATTTQLLCEVPKGSSYDPIAVVNTANQLIAFAKNSFSVTFAGANPVTANSFYKALVLPSAPITDRDIFPVSAIAGDINGDGKNDVLAIVRYYQLSDSIFIYKNTTHNDISFAAKLAVASGSFISVADMDADGKLDIVYLNTQKNIGILRNTSSPDNISFATPVFFTLTNGARNFCTADINGDGRADIIMPGYDNANLGILQNTSIGSTIDFAPILEFPVPDLPSAVAAGDLDGDGKTDIIISSGIVTSFTTPVINVFKNTSTGGKISFAPNTSLSVLANVAKLFVTDVNNDGKPDISIANIAIRIPAFSVFKNNISGGALSFGSRIDVDDSQPSLALYGEIGNLTGDSLPDYVSVKYDDVAFDLYKNTSAAGNVAFSAPVIIYGREGDNQTVCSSDFDGDGKQDILIACDFGGASMKRGFYIYRNGIGEPVNAPACPGNVNTFTSNISSAVYRWQVDTGAGYVNITDDNYYSGANTNQLTITATPTSWYGYQYRCISNGQNSESYKLVFQNSWIGSASSSWENAANWSCGVVPDGNSDVIINSGNIILNSNAAVRSLKVASSASFNILPAFTLTIKH